MIISKGKVLKTISLVLVLTMLFTSTVFATEADYYDVGYLKFNGVYVNRWGQTIPGVVRRGIDVSSYQGVIDWPAVASDDVSFAFIRCGNTKSGPDSMYDTNMSGAIANGIEVGVYYASYAMNEDVARLEGQYAVASAQKYNVTLPIVYDVEGAVMASLGAAQLQKNLAAFCEVVRAAGYTPMLYSNKTFLTKYYSGVDCDIWVARYADQCDYTGAKKFWQCSSHGWVKGIQGRVDLDFQY